MSPDAAHRTSGRIFLISLFMLFVELLLIRWIATEIRIFAYFKNLTLIGCFLGIGLGCLLAERRALSLVWSFLIIVVLAVIVVVPSWLGSDPFRHLSEQLSAFNDMPLWNFAKVEATSSLTAVAFLSLLLIFALIVASMIPIGNVLGRAMNQARDKNVAYSWDIAGSIVGIWAFSALCAFNLPPALWFLAALPLGLLLMDGWRQRAIGLALIGALTAMLWPQASEVKTIWSPYQKLDYSPLLIPVEGGEPLEAGVQVNVNTTFYQRGVNLSQAFLDRHAALIPEAPRASMMSYNLIYRLIPRPKNVLVVGAGTGNDVAAALRNGAAHVDAVEIDPQIAEIGKRFHPEQPYSDPRVNLIIDDARSYFNRTDKRYDLIVFGALDSHTLNSALSNIRIDNYVYTVGSFREARNLLTEKGVLNLVFSAEKAFIVHRLRRMLEAAFGHPPIAFLNEQPERLGPAGGGPTFWIDRDRGLERRINASATYRPLIRSRQMVAAEPVPLGTDDWPYLYLESRSIPRLYLVVIAAIVLLATLLIRPLIGGYERIDGHFLMLGAGFLLVEVQAISKMALIFGTTWFVNSIVFSSVLGMILLANLFAAKVKQPPLALIYALLAASLVLNYVFPLDLLLPLQPVLRGLAAGSLMSLPIFFAGVIFIRTFSCADATAAALGSNLFGALLGGLCESLSFVIGLKALALVALVFYLGSFVLLRRQGPLSRY